LLFLAGAAAWVIVPPSWYLISRLMTAGLLAFVFVVDAVMMFFQGAPPYR
jgi:hypothetical protein